MKLPESVKKFMPFTIAVAGVIVGLAVWTYAIKPEIDKKKVSAPATA